MSGGYGHQTVLLREAADALAIKESGTYVDATFGGGGHTREILARLGPTGRIVALDRDASVVAEGRAGADPRLTLVHAPFSRLAHVLRECAAAKADGLLADLGVSSRQLDDPARGFSFRFDAPLDMRMDTSRGQSAAQWLAAATQEQIARVLKDYGEERFAHAIAKAVVAARAAQPVTTTRQFAALVAGAVRTREPAQHPATRSFQALRILVNQELEELSLMLPQALRALTPGGRLVAISFHSLEDRIVKRFIDAHAHPDRPGARERALPLRAAELPAPRLTTLARVRADAAEVALNPRARSAVLRAAERTAAPWPHLP